LKTPGHLCIEEIRLAPAGEWMEETGAWRFARVASGAAYWLGPPKPRELAEGEVMVIRPATRALVRASRINSVLLHSFAFSPELLCGFLTLPERRSFESGREQESIPVEFLPPNHSLARQFALLDARQDSGRGLVQRARLLGLVASFFDDTLAAHDAPEGGRTSAHKRFEQVISRMPDMELVRHSPRQLARLCGCSPRHFSRLFREQFGEPPRLRQTELRLLQARQLLATSDKRIMQIALDSGFRSLSLFNLQFRRRFGMSPSEWRQQAGGSRPPPA
jgi:AraC-like DNA-binding protein